MAERHRLEDLGRIQEKLESICDNHKWPSRTSCKHDYERFIEYYEGETNLDELFDELKCLNSKLEEILEIAQGNN